MKIQLCIFAAATFLGPSAHALSTARLVRTTKVKASVKVSGAKKLGVMKLGVSKLGRTKLAATKLGVMKLGVTKLGSATLGRFLHFMAQGPRADLHEGNPSAEGKYGQVEGGRTFIDGVDLKDVHQGHLGDCYFVAALAAVAYTHPEVIEKALTENKDGSYSLRMFHRTAAGQLESDNVKMDASLPLSGGRPVYARGANPKQLWPALFQKGYAMQVVANGGGLHSYQQIGNGGYPGDAFEALTGVPSQRYAISPQTADQMYTVMQHAVAGKNPAAAWTPPKVPAGVVYGDHTYTILGVSEHDGQKFVKLRNPWGQSPGADGIFELDLPTFAKTFSNLDVGG